MRAASLPMRFSTPPRQLRESDLDSFAESFGNSLKHRKRMAFVVGVFEPANDRCGRADQPGKLPLGKASLSAKMIDLFGNFGVRQLFFDGSNSAGVMAYVSLIEELQRFGLEFSLGCHAYSSG